eukprot:TRINITY_DN11516_c0_g1_i1.p1 TRINITY_DN11516_c0_g1~~TRINITY_DN11516_c0_g1_i1.p1  ORF type:complete len:551 (-),score=112.30 TRINITY_DN11516_c0_g1_i1:12-1664(-)
MPPKQVKPRYILAKRDNSIELLSKLLLSTKYIRLSLGNLFSLECGCANIQEMKKKVEYLIAGGPLTLNQLTTSPETFYGFWGKYYNMCTGSEPHINYKLLKQILFTSNSENITYIRDTMVDLNTNPAAIQYSQHKGGRSYGKGIVLKRQVKDDDPPVPYQHFSIVTSLLDGHLIRAGFDNNDIFHLKGSITDWQCSEKCTKEITNLPTDFRFVIDPLTLQAVFPSVFSRHVEILEVEKAKQLKESLKKNKKKKTTPFAKKNEEPKKIGLLRITQKSFEEPFPRLVNVDSVEEQNMLFSKLQKENTSGSRVFTPRIRSLNEPIRQYKHLAKVPQNHRKFSGLRADRSEITCAEIFKIKGIEPEVKPLVSTPISFIPIAENNDAESVTEKPFESQSVACVPTWNHPICKKCGKALRPHIRLLNDTSFFSIGANTSNNWLEMVINRLILNENEPHPEILVLFEIGVVDKKLRMMNELILERHEFVFLVRVNSVDSGVPEEFAGRCISIDMKIEKLFQELLHTMNDLDSYVPENEVSSLPLNVTNTIPGKKRLV